MELARFMPKYHDMAELAPRDVVARAIAHEMELVKSPNAVVYLDMTHLNAKHIEARFPRIYKTCLEYNVDIATDLVPVRPAAHYAMGGVRTDLDGRTNLRGLFAAGEAACTGVHGANRLASNSLLEGLVFGARAAKTMREELREGGHHAAAEHPHVQPASDNAAASTSDVVQQIRDLMWREVGIVRTGSQLKRAIHELQKLREGWPQPMNRAGCEAANIHQVAMLIAKSALAREESRGAQYRTDYPLHNDAKFKKHSIVKGELIRFE
jgi:L-aspartate oxidase